MNDKEIGDIDDDNKNGGIAVKKSLKFLKMGLRTNWRMKPWWTTTNFEINVEHIGQMEESKREILKSF